MPGQVEEPDIVGRGAERLAKLRGGFGATVELGEVEYGEVEIGHEAKIRLLPPSAQSCVEACRSVAIRVTQAVRCEPTP